VPDLWQAIDRQRIKGRKLKKSPRISALVSLACGIGLLPSQASADEAPDREIVVSARLDDPAQDTVGPAQRLARDDLAAQAPVSLLESLALLPGIDAFEKGGPGGGSYLALRGGEPNFTLVAINGVRVNDPMVSSGGAFDFSLLAPRDVARIDVLTGPWSTAYGADALSGVVSLRLSDPDDEAGVTARMGLGSGERYELGGRAQVSGRAGSLTLAASARDTNDLFDRATSRGQSAMIAATPDLGSTVSLDLFGLYAHSKGSGFPEDSGGPRLAVFRDPETREREQIALGASLRAALAAQLSGQLRLGFSRSTLDSQSPGIAPGVLDGVPPLASDSRFERFEAVGSIDWTPRESLAFALGASFVRESGVSEGTIDFGELIPTGFAIHRSLPGVFATAALVLPQVELRLGLRADFPEQGKNRITPRAGLVVPLGTSGLRLTANYAQGFKQPSLFALGFPLIANPDLLPERSRTIDAGIGWASADDAMQASVTAYRSVYRDLIDFDPERFTNVNRDKVMAQGVELAASGRTGAFRLIASLTYLDAKSADGAPLRFRPEWKGAAALEWQANDALSLRLDGRFSGRFTDSSVPTGFVRLGGYATLDAQASYRLSPALTLSASLRNLANECYARTVGTPEPGRNLFVSLHGTL
jgi:vitamin B12 transporter